MLGPVPGRGVGATGSSARSDTAFDAFAREHRRSPVALAWTLIGDVGAAEEVAQDALHEVARNSAVLGSHG